MDSKRIIIIGCGGSGKSTLAKSLGDKLKLPVIHLDKIFWKANWQHISHEEFESLLLIELKKESWIIDGNFDRTIQTRLKYCDTIIFLDYSRITCMIGAFKRIFLNYGKTRSDMGENCNERIDLDYLKWIWNFNKNKRQKYLKMLEDSSMKQIFIFHNRNQCKNFMKTK